ncbi:cyclic AMP-responsive element-binding protein 3-like protein 2 [Protopterus annectens]|uniref:cyclic AMP-responsive element-binding protein 3-like protein 2 n=1 Tax=Protopterus annectens TaxID=7888 RepID=UPI001CFBC683|nr:cyclic AMP-responsive element-binding protein 3-like protein 2 [Protopterus annectens]
MDLILKKKQKNHHITPAFKDPQSDLKSEEWNINAEVKVDPLHFNIPGLLPSVTLTIAATSVLLQSDSSVQPNDASFTNLPSLLTSNNQAGAVIQSVLPNIKLEPHEVDQFLNLPQKETDSVQLPPTPPSSLSSDSEDGHSPIRSLQSSGSDVTHVAVKVATHSPSALSDSPLLTAPHKLQGTGPLTLTEEEKRTLIAEGYPVPNRLPLTKAEEKALKKIRRKIKNKISAQESRRKKKEYMDSLEKRVETCSNENTELRKKVEALENANRTLLHQLQRLQVMVAGRVSRSYKVASTQTSTCIMVMILCFAVALGSFSQSFGPYSSIAKTALSNQISTQELYASSVVRSRNLLHYEDSAYPEERYTAAPSADHMVVWNTQKEMSLYVVHTLEKTEDQKTEREFRPVNSTVMEKSAIMDTQTHWVNLELYANKTKIVEIDGRVNTTS